MISELTSAVAGGVGELLNLVPTPGKLTIIPVSEYFPPKLAGPPYVAMFNPENWQTQDNIQYNDAQSLGGKDSQQRFQYQGTKTLSIDLIVDGTGAGGETREVLVDILALQKTTGFNGDEHRSNKLIVIWGTQIFKGVLQTMSVKYTLFRANGTPLRATVSLGFGGDTPRLESILQMNLKSADLTHRRTVKSGDRLDLLCQNIYRDSRYYLEVAEKNRLTSFRKLPVGDELIFPPVEK